MGDAEVAPLPEGTQVIDAEGLHLVPGFIALASQVGLVETLQVDADRLIGENPLTARRNLRRGWRSIPTAISFQSPAAPAFSTPSSFRRVEPFPAGRASFASMGGRPRTSRCCEMRASWCDGPLPPPSAHRGCAAARRNSARASQSSAQRSRGSSMTPWRGMPRGTTTQPRPATFALKPWARCWLVNGPRLLHRQQSVGQIEESLAFSVSRGLKPVILGGAAAPQCLASLKAADASVIIHGVHRLPLSRHRAWDDPFSLALRLHEAEIPFAIAAGDEPAHERGLIHNAATAVAHGPLTRGSPPFHYQFGGRNSRCQRTPWIDPPGPLRLVLSL